MDIKDCIKTIIENEIQKGQLFDSHMIILRLIQGGDTGSYSNAYLEGYRTLFSNPGTTELYHAKIGKMIGTFEPTLIEKIGQNGQSWSKNIHDKFSSCTAWRKK